MFKHMLLFFKHFLYGHPKLSETQHGLKSVGLKFNISPVVGSCRLRMIFTFLVGKKINTSYYMRITQIQVSINKSVGETQLNKYVFGPCIATSTPQQQKLNSYSR